MFRTAALWIIALLGFAAVAGPAAAGHSHPTKVNVRFLATSTSVRNSWATSQDVYLIEIVPHTADEPVLARLIDDNPQYHETFLAKRLTSAEGTTLREALHKSQIHSQLG